MTDKALYVPPLHRVRRLLRKPLSFPEPNDLEGWYFNCYADIGEIEEFKKHGGASQQLLARLEARILRYRQVMDWVEALVEHGAIPVTPAERQRIAADARKESARSAAEAKHKAKAPEYEERVRCIMAEWASGRYKSRNQCAEKAYQKCGFPSVKTARDALIGSPDP